MARCNSFRPCSQAAALASVWPRPGLAALIARAVSSGL